MYKTHHIGWAGTLVACVSLSFFGCGGGDDAITPSGNGGGLTRRDSGGDSGGSSDAPTTGEGWGTLKGTFVYDGDPPTLPLLQTGGKDEPTCNPDGIINEALLVDEASKGIGNIAVYLRSRASRVNEDYDATADEEVVFDQKGCVFLSRVLPMRVSQPLLIKNSDPVAHNTNISPRGDSSTNPLLSPNSEDKYEFGRQQNLPVAVSCNVHPWMKSYILPRNDPYATITDAQGQFEIAKLPAGEEIDFQIWHESATGDNNVLVIEGLTDDEGRFTKTIPQDSELDLGTIQVPASAFSAQ